VESNKNPSAAINSVPHFFIPGEKDAKKREKTAQACIEKQLDKLFVVLHTYAVI